MLPKIFLNSTNHSIQMDNL